MKKCKYPNLSFYNLSSLVLTVKRTTSPLAEYYLSNLAFDFFFHALPLSSMKQYGECFHF